MEGADLPFLHGRDKTAERLGVTYADGKRLVGQLIKEGKIVVEGKRLRLVKAAEVEILGR
jgi:ribosomal protein L27